MNKKALKTLEYNKIIALLEQCAGSAQGKAYCRELLPVSDLSQIKRMQAETKDALSRIFKRGSVSFSGITDVRPFLKHLEIGSSLTILELLAIASLLEVAKRVKTYGRSENDLSIEGDHLAHFFNDLEPLTPVCQEIRHCILSEDSIADDASPGLKNIRRQKNVIGERIRTQMNTMLNNNTTRSYLQDGVITVRGGRYCLPVKAEYRSSFHGMLHDQSATGATLFIEPNSVVKLNNEIRELERLEQDEIDKVLADLSNQTAEQSFLVEQDHRILTELDFIFAKAMLAKQMKATKPRFPEERFIEIKQGRHPLIAADKVVPIDVHLGRDFSLLIVTGPNTGGKTVSLKTVGLFCLMGQAGLHIPAFDGSSLRIFHEVYADIGDEQSIEQSLSTFSSHMVNTVSILEQADENSLALFDELGAGTDPTEGAALATAILANLHKRHTLTMATTHYSELKLYALQTPDVENACCEFDVSTLRPTYRLLIGVPGKSNAFAISHKLGLSDDIIEDAKHHVASDATQFEDVLADLEQTRIRLEKELADASESRKEISRLRKELREKNDKIDNSKERILQNANEEAGRILAKAKDYADETIRKYTKWAESDAHIREMEAERTKLREQINSKQSHSLKPAKPKKASGLKAKDLFIGADVRILSLNSAGTVSTLPNDKGDLFVQAGLLRTKVNIRDLELIKQPKPEKNKTKNTGSGRIGMSKAATMHQEVNLIGMTVDQAMPVMEKYLDDAYLAHMTQVTVIHGRGTGALRTAVHNRLKKLKYVKSYRLGEFGEGDMGVTIVTFKS